MLRGEKLGLEWVDEMAEKTVDEMAEKWVDEMAEKMVDEKVGKWVDEKADVKVVRWADEKAVSTVEKLVLMLEKRNKRAWFLLQLIDIHPNNNTTTPLDWSC